MSIFCKQITAISLFAMGAVAAAQQVFPIDRVIAVVNTEVITLGELSTGVLNTERQLIARNRPIPSEEALRRQVLERLIVERAQLQFARQIGLRITDDQLQSAIENIARENQLTLSGLRDRLTTDGVKFDAFRRSIRAQMIRARLKETEVQSRVTVSEADIDAFLASRKTASTQAAQYNVSQLLLKLPEEATESELQQRTEQAQALIKRLNGGETFESLVASESDAADSASLGWRTLEQLPEVFAQRVRFMKAGQISEVVRSPAGLHILKLTEVRNDDDSVLSDQPVDQTRVRHILIRPDDSNPRDEILQRLSQIKDRVDGGVASFEEMARQYSVDGSAARGGDLGWVLPGDTVPAFERAMNSLANNQISEPIQTQFGYHLIQVIERRQEKASDERARRSARLAVTKQRTEQAWREWLAELRDRTYVELRFEEN